jgi:hypothetical protein
VGSGRNQTRRLVQLWTTLLLAAVFLSACAPAAKRSRRLQQDCVLAADQEGSLLGKWSRNPVPIAVEQSAFTVSEVSQIRAGADTWNTFFSNSMGTQALNYLEGGAIRVSATPYQTLTCNPADAAIQNGTFVRSITIYKRTNWPQELTNVIAATYSCPVDGRPLKTFSDAVIALNFQDFWSSGRPIPDIQTILSHELGHLLGLRHSCENGSDLAGMPNCSNAPASYRLAVMRPQFGFDAFMGQQVRTLNENDQGRMNCLYKLTNAY